VKINARKVCEDNGPTLYYDTVIEDVSERKRLQQELQRRERMATMGELAAMIAHEIRNPLAAVLNSAEELQARIDTSGTESVVFTGTNRRLLEIILEEAERLERIVHDFLNFARPSQPKFAPTDINQILEKTRAGNAGAATESRCQNREATRLRSAHAAPGCRADNPGLFERDNECREAIKGPGTIRVKTSTPHITITY
jgi:signal transduction histidine kinase